MQGTKLAARIPEAAGERIEFRELRVIGIAGGSARGCAHGAQYIGAVPGARGSGSAGVSKAKVEAVVRATISALFRRPQAALQLLFCVIIDG